MEDRAFGDVGRCAVGDGIGDDCCREVGETSVLRVDLLVASREAESVVFLV